jgi:hypothetical protein
MVGDLTSSLESQLLARVLQEVAELVRNKSPSAILREFRDTLQVCLRQVQAAGVSPGPKLTMAVDALVETATTYTQEVLLLISLSLAACENPALLQSHDKLFSQCLVALATGFSRQLVAAARGQLNPEPEYGVSGEDMSSGWLQLVANKGVLLHLEALLTPVSVGGWRWERERVSLPPPPGQGGEAAARPGLRLQTAQVCLTPCGSHGDHTGSERPSP